MPGSEHKGDMYGDHLVEMTTDGRLVREYRLWEQLDSGNRPDNRDSGAARRLEQW